jgi:hypothetical protein
MVPATAEMQAAPPSEPGKFSWILTLVTWQLTDVATLTPVPLALAGHLVSITMAFTGPEQTARGSKVSMKKLRTAKSDHIVIENTSRGAFIKSFLAVNDLADQYSPGVHTGPSFKLWWAGSP